MTIHYRLTLPLTAKQTNTPPKADAFTPNPRLQRQGYTTKQAREALITALEDVIAKAKPYSENLKFWQKSLEDLQKWVKDLADQREAAPEDFHLVNTKKNRPTNLYLVETNLSGQNLTTANLAGANLAGANLTKTRFASANLSGAILSNANLTGAYLEGANLSKATCQEADLTGANLTKANLTEAILYRATLKNAIFNQANLLGARLSKDISKQALTNTPKPQLKTRQA